MDLDIQYTFPRPNLDFNHLGTKTYDMGAGDFSMNPAYGFATGDSLLAPRTWVEKHELHQQIAMNRAGTLLTGRLVHYIPIHNWPGYCQ